MLVRSLLVGVLFTWTCVAHAHPALVTRVAADSIMFDAEAERLFDEGMTRFRDGRYQAAVERFQRILDEFRGSQRATAALIMGAKSHYELGAIRPARVLLGRLLAEYPESRFLDDARYMLGLCSFHSGEYERAAMEFLEAAETSRETILLDRARDLLLAIARQELTFAQLQAIRDRSVRKPLQNRLTVVLAEKAWSMGDVQAAREVLRPLVAQPSSDPGVGEGLLLMQRIERSGVVKVGVVLPLMRNIERSFEGELGDELWNGIRFAADEHNTEGMPKVTLDLRDSENDEGVAARQVSELSADQDVLAIMGPAFSNEVSASAGIANAIGVPLITPTATANGLAAIGEYIFQANPDLSIRSRAMVQFAHDRQRATRFAILAPNDTAGKAMASAFEDEVKRLGGEMVDVQWYPPGETDLRVQLGTMRRKALERLDSYLISFSPRMKGEEIRKLLDAGVARSTVDSLMVRNASVPVEFLLGPDGKRMADSLMIPLLHVPVKYDSLGIPVTTIDAIFLPIAAPSEIGIVTSHLRYFNFQAQLLGTGNWWDMNELEQNRTYANGVLFTTDAYWDEQDAGFQALSRRVLAATGKRPTRNMMFGYDGMKLLLKAISQGATRRSEIASALTRVRMFEGAHGRISIDEGRVNTVLSVLQYRNRQVRRIAEIDVARKEITLVP